eukprot:10471344-Lingulodinium_polyedra.AAC.1
MARRDSPGGCAESELSVTGLCVFALRDDSDSTESMLVASTSCGRTGWCSRTRRQWRRPFGRREG